MKIVVCVKQVPSGVKYTKELADTVLAVKEAGADASVQAEMLADISGLDIRKSSLFCFSYPFVRISVAVEDNSGTDN